MVIAENTLGYDKFIEKMNETASRIGMKNTIFANPHGLDEQTKNYSTAYDMALLMRYAMKNEEFQGDIEYGLNSVEQGETNEILNEIVVNEI